MAKNSDILKVSKALGVNPHTVRRGLEQGVLPFGAAIKCDKEYSYVLFPEAVKRELGVILDERKD